MVDIFVGEQLLDVSYGMPITLSSIVGGALPRHLVPASAPAAPLFRTDLEDAPWITVDLLCPRHIHRIRVFNNEVDAFPYLPLAISISNDNANWTDVFVTDQSFGGKVTDEPLVVTFSHFVICRYVRLQSRARATLRLHYIELCALLPMEYLGKLRNIRVTETDVAADYWHHDSYGFAWTFTCTLGMILSARLLGVTIDRVDYRLCLRDFKDSPDEDAYQWLFEARPRTSADLPDQLPAFERHAVYTTLPLGILQTYADLYFRPHRRVIAFADQLLRLYGLDLSKTIVLLYRGTDKVIEVTPATPESYVAVARALMAREPGLTVLCQTDQAQARDAIVREEPQAVYFAELPVTGGSTAIHNLDVSAEFALSKSELSLRLLAMTWLVSRARYVVTHTGNLAAWVAIYRGRTDGLYQFCEDGKLRGPDATVLSLNLEPQHD